MSGLSPRLSQTISIPQRCDYFGLVTTPTGAATAISIPQRCDYFSNTSIASGQPVRISIPQRCDYFSISSLARRLMRFNFNTTKVRLFLRLYRHYCELYPKFQYHKGAIISLLRYIQHFCCFSNFNTTKVRLFPVRPWWSTRSSTHFNTTKVRLFPCSWRQSARRAA